MEDNLLEDVLGESYYDKKGFRSETPRGHRYIAHISIEDNDYRCSCGSIEVEVSTWEEGIDYCKLNTWSGESYHLMKLTSLDYKQQFKSKTIWEEYMSEESTVEQDRQIIADMLKHFKGIHDKRNQELIDAGYGDDIIPFTEVTVQEIKDYALSGTIWGDV